MSIHTQIMDQDNSTPRQWREMEEQHNFLKKENLKIQKKNTLFNTNTTNTFQNQNRWDDGFSLMKNENINNTAVKSEDEDCMLECEVKLEVPDVSDKEMEEHEQTLVKTEKEVNNDSTEQEDKIRWP